MIRYHARWVVPIARPPIRDGTVVEAGGHIVYVGERRGAPAGEDRELGDAILLPGLVNTHTHLELTAFRGLFENLPFREWILELQRAKTDVMTPERFLDAARLGVHEGLRSGVTTYADTCDSGVTLQAMRELGVRGIMYQEVFGPSPAPDDVRQTMRALEAKLERLLPDETELQRVGVSPHAPFTVSSELFARVAEGTLPMAIHVAESEAETQLVCDAAGPFADGLRARGLPVQPRGRTPVAMLEALGVLARRPLLIHCVRVDDTDIAAIAASGSTVAHCPLSNAKLGHGVAPLLELLAAGIAVGLGSDSMASNNRMDLLEEARAALLMQRVRRRRHDALDAPSVLALATLGGARALGLEQRIGSLEEGKAADLVAFDLSDERGVPAYDPESAAVLALGGQPARFVCVGGSVRVWERRILGQDVTVAARVRETASALAAWRSARS